MHLHLIRSLFAACIIFGVLVPTRAQQSWSAVGADLESRIRDNQTGPFPVFILLADRVDVNQLGASYEAENLPQHLRTQDLISRLQQKAANTQGPVLSILQSQEDVVNGSIRPFWITNTIYAEVGVETLTQLDQVSSIELIELAPVPEIAGATPVPASPEDLLGAGGHEISLDIINAPALWAMGYTGNGRKALIIDTGTEPTHPALWRSFVGNYEDPALGWYGSATRSTPEDCDNHGTHVAGTILGVDRDTKDTIGVAPNGLWMASPAIECSSGPSATGALQWAINPDGDPATTADMPDAINNSWRFLPNGWGCSSPVQQAINALEAAGVAVISAAGNDNPDYSVGGPAYANYSLVNSFAVGAITPNTTLSIAGFSSRGPSACGGTGSLAIKPEVVAPGVNIRSAVRGGVYAVYQGTSMASPHVAGAVLLLKEAFPEASGTQIKFALYNTAIDLGEPGEDNTYGNGLIDVEAAFYELVNQGLTPAPVSRDVDASVRLTEQQPCGLDHEPEVRLENVGLQPLTSAEFLRVYADGYSDTVTWAGTILPGETSTISLDPHTFGQPGRYGMKLTLIRANAQEDPFFIDNWDTTTFSVFQPLTATSRPVNICIGGEGVVEATLGENDPNGEVFWFDQAEGGERIGKGSEFHTGVLTASQMYFIGTGRQYRLGPEPDMSQGGLFDNTTNLEVPFEVYFPCTIEQVTVLANSPGERIIQIREGVGSLMYSKVVDLPAGVSTIELGASMDPGKRYYMTLGFATGDLWVQGTNAQPIGIDGVMAFTNTQTGQLPYFFDWVVSYELPCPRIPAIASVSPGTLDPTFSATETAPNTISFTANPSNGRDYRWYLGDGTIAAGRTVTHKYAAPGTYDVELMVTGQAYCADLTGKPVDVQGITGIDEDLAANFRVFPNPAERVVNVSWDGQEMVEAGLFDLTGRQVSESIVLSPQSPVHQWSVESLSEGIFWIQLIREGRVSVIKVVKSK